MPSIDERVVAMSFENTVFESRVATTMTTLSRLDTAVKNIGNTQGFQNIESAANRVNLEHPMSALDKLRAKLGGAGTGAAQGFSDIDRAGNKVTLEGPSRAVDKLQGKMGQLSAGSTFTDIEKASSRVSLAGLTRALDNVQAKFSVLEGAASVALGNIASKAVAKGAAFSKSFAFGPIKQGFEEYSTNLGSIQTILANTQGQQDSGLKTTKSHLGELNKYSDRTIYNFSQMAKNIGTFTAAGVDLDKSTQSIKGIANLAALSGSNSQQASTAMYQLSQAIASGRVGLQDWNSVVNAGMGGAVFQKALMRTASNMGTVEKGAVKIDKATGKATVNGQSFRESITARPGEKSWLTSDVLVKTLGQFTGDLTDAQLAAQGFNAEQIKTIQQTAKSAQNAATEVKTLPQAFDVARESIGSGWAKTFELIFGDFEESKKTFTEFSNFINGFISKVSDARNKVLGDWKKLGGRTVLIEGIKTAFQNLMAIITPIKDAFRDIFPAKTGQDLFNMTKNFTNLMVSLKPSPQLIDNLRRIFAGLFAVLHIGWTIIKAVGGVFFDLLGIVGKGSGGFLGFIAGIADFIVAIDKAIASGNVFKGIFKTLGSIIAVPLRLLMNIGKAIANLFGGGKTTKLDQIDELNRFGKVLTPMERIVNNLKDAWANLVKKFEITKQALEPWFSAFVEKLKDIGTILVNAFKNLDFDNAMSAIQTGLVAGLLVTLRKALGDKGIIGALTKSLGSISGVFGALTGNLEAMQKKVQAQTILTIAAAILALAAGIFILSKIDADALAKAMTAVAVGLGELMGAMKLMMGGMGKLGFLQLPVIAASMIGLAIAVTILAGAMKIFSTMKWEDIGKGLIGVGGAIAAVALSMKLMPPTLPLTAAGLILIGIALNLIATAMLQFGSMKLEEIAKGIFVMVDALGGIALGVSMMPPTLPLTAAGLILMGIALAAIGGSIKSMGSMDIATIVKGLATMMAAIAGIGLAVSLVPPTIALSAAGLLVIGSAMVVIAGAISILGKLSIGTLVKGLVGMAGALVILAFGLTMMTGTLPGAAALMAAALALAVLAPTLAFLGAMSWETIIKGLIAIALALGTLALVGGLAAGPLSALGVALLPLAGVFVLTAGAVFIFAKALSLLGAEGGKGIAVMVTALTAFVALIPKLVIDLLKGFVSIIDQLRVLLPKVVVALGLIIDTVIAFVIKSAPKLAIAVGVLVDAFLQVILTNAPKIISAGFKLLLNFLSGISHNIGQVVTKVSEIITKFLNALAAKAPQLVNSGARVLVAFLQGITNKIPQIVTTVANMIIKFINALSVNVPKVIFAAERMMIKFVAAIASFAPKLLNKGVEILLNFLEGIERAIPRIKNKALDVARTFLNNLADGLVRLANIGFNALIKFLNGLAEAIRNNQPRIRQAGWNIASAIMEGIVAGFKDLINKVVDGVKWVIDKIPSAAKKILGVHSPSQVFAEIGAQTMLGMAKGIGDNHSTVLAASEDMAKGLIGSVRTTLGIHSPSEVMRDIGKEVGTGFSQGVRGSASEIRGAFSSLNDRLKENMTTARKTIKDEQAKLNEELRKKRPDLAVIQEAHKVINQNNQVLRATSEAHRVLVVGLKEEKRELIGLTKDYANVTKKLDAAQQVLAEATRARDEARKSYAEKFGETPTIETGEEVSGQTALEKYKQQLQERIVATQKYAQTLQQLRALGLDDTTYKKLLEQGVQGQAFAEALLLGGKGGIQAMNALDKQLMTAAGALAKQASTNLYQAGVNAAQGLVNGLKAKQKDIAATMENLARLMVRSIKRQLKIRSPSQIFGEIGQLSIEGLAAGLRSNTKAVEDAAANVGDSALSAMRNSLSGISEHIDVDPVITPVLDLTQIEKGAKGLADLTNVTPITAAASFSQAAAISDMQKAVPETGQAAQTGPTFNYEQNNYSPESLSDIEIYRQTKNQLSQVKSALGLVP